MRKIALALMLISSPTFAQTPNLAPAPPVKCLPIGKTSKGDLVYPLDCRDIPLSSGVSNEPEPVASSAPAATQPKAPESK
jgi:hypothetical protein